MAIRFNELLALRSKLTRAMCSSVVAGRRNLIFFSCQKSRRCLLGGGDSATGHTCSDKSLFSGELIPSIYIVGAATGTSEPTLMGAVVLRFTDYNCDKHTFTLTHVNYMPKSPVNLLSTRVLSKQSTNEHSFDQQGTGILSVFDDHTLFWDHGQCSKTFKTHSSGLSECLFSSGYSQLQSFTTFLMPYYDDTVNWAYMAIS